MMTRKIMALAIALCAVAAISCSTSGLSTSVADNAQAPAAERCAGLAQLRIENVEIDAATPFAAGASVPGTSPGMAPGQTGPDISGIPAFCRVMGRIHAEAGSNIRFEVWLPIEGWNGRMMGAGNGGFAGYISHSELSSAVSGGYAGTSTDTGHAGNAFDGSWARGRPELVRDYGWRAVHLTTVTAKQVVEAFYGRAPERSYFASCSNGGRQGLMEASRFPEDYDGIIVGAPAVPMTSIAMSMAWTGQAQQAPGAAIRADQMPLLQQEVLAQCDALDGQTDGLVGDPHRCTLNTRRLACGVSSSAQCFSPEQITALERIYQGPRDSAGRQIAAGFPASGAEVGNPLPQMGWGGWILRGQGAMPAHDIFARGLLTDLTQAPFTTPQEFDFDRDPARLREALSADLDAQPDLRRFFDRGGKMIMFHGWADAGLAPQGTIDFYEAALHWSGPRARDSIRLFMVPGMQHCSGGAGPAEFGQGGAPARDDTAEDNIARALEAWVEHGRSPERLIGRITVGAPASASNQNQRLLCPYPNQAVLHSGPANRAASYVCRAPASP